MLYRRLAMPIVLVTALLLTAHTPPAARADETGVIEAPGNPKVVFEPGVQPKQASKKSTRESRAPKPFKQPRITVKLGPTTLGEAVRKIGTASRPSLVLMNGVEQRTVKELSLRNVGFDSAVKKICEAERLESQRCPNYTFLFPKGYEQLQDVSVEGKINPAFNVACGGMAFGSGLNLFTVFSWISYALNITIVADDAIADARCGELVLGDIPLPDAIEAILKSARVAAFEIDSTDQYIFVYVPSNKSEKSQLLNADKLDDAQRKFLEHRVPVILPKAPAPGETVAMARIPSPLKDVLPSLSSQLGATVVAEAGLDDLPVNPVIFRGASVQSILDLIVRQWLEPKFGYQVLQDRIVIRKR